MYNRYIPQPDGTYRRNRIQEPVKEVPKTSPSPEISLNTPANSPSCQECIHNQAPRRPMPLRQKNNIPPVGIGSFFKSLLPRDFDTEDLLIVLLLLLMASDDQEDQNSALLTLALYLFM